MCLCISWWIEMSYLRCWIHNLFLIYLQSHQYLPYSSVLFLVVKCSFVFIHRPVGMPKMEKVYLHNPSSEEISLISISATTSHFHASFFQNRVSMICYVYIYIYYFIHYLSNVWGQIYILKKWIPLVSKDALNSPRLLFIDIN